MLTRCITRWCTTIPQRAYCTTSHTSTHPLSDDDEQGTPHQHVHSIDSNKAVALLDEQHEGKWDALTKPTEPGPEACCQVVRVCSSVLHVFTMRHVPGAVAWTKYI